MRAAAQSKAPRSLPATQGQRARPIGRRPDAPRSSLGCAPGRKLAVQRTKGSACRKKPPRRETARGIERAPTRKLKRSPHPMRSGAGQTGTGLGGSVTTHRLRDNTPRDHDVNCRLRKGRPESRPPAVNAWDRAERSCDRWRSGEFIPGQSASGHFRLRPRTGEILVGLQRAISREFRQECEVEESELATRAKAAKTSTEFGGLSA